jgi:2-polyprenyl-3-methyl-5-hydroxy-6-metoxy-1,4-benzoquinol methylase
MKKTNQELKKLYGGIFKKGYEKTYTSTYTDKVNKGLDLTEEIKEVLKEGNWKDKTVIDVGCGTGLFAYAVAKKGAKVIGLDYTPEAIEVAKTKWQHPNLEYKVGDANSLKGKYDVIVSIGTLEHMDDPFTVLKIFKRHLKKGGKLVITCPNWVNPRGYVLQTLLHLFDAPITLADLHYLTPLEFEDWAKKLKMKLGWRTFDRSWAHGEKLLTDFRRRLPNVLRDAKLPNKQENIDRFIEWLEKHVLPLDHDTVFSGALAIYIFKQK